MMQDLKIQSPSQIMMGPNAAGSRDRQSPPSTFGQALQQSLEKVNRLQLEADASIDALASGKQTDIHQTMIAVEKASVSFELLMQIRNKVIAAYDNLMRTQV